MFEFFYLAAKGYVVTFSNPRGGTGYGEAHGASIWNAAGTADYDDVMAWPITWRACPTWTRTAWGSPGEATAAS